MPDRSSRRRFVKVGSITVGALGLGSVGNAATRESRNDSGDPVADSVHERG
ncbi:twin-arginine translocation signal domain-containing protein [Natrinema altunense]|uniref:Twin-arginine translocation signal domain-containing protein n=1 Tax=Natrinema altunense TaxID=222984 RepID=A0A482Y167_9EURY|nr:twin-arginine translocation signal domain-containing protein [Natrinema altunense]RZH67496.1 twin-arginine translocation signal domain-containing protein [Natrinema altunense]